LARVLVARARGDAEVRRLGRHEKFTRMDRTRRAAKVAYVARDGREFVLQCRGRDQAVLDGHGTPMSAQLGEQLRPAQAGFGTPGQTEKLGHALFKPPFEAPAALAGRQQVNAEANLAEDDRVDRQVGLVALQPVDDFICRLRPGLVASLSTLASTR
jgi:hypothetical protein